MSGENIEKLSVREILQRIHDGLLDPLALSKNQRQVCVEVLIFDGWQQPSIAELFKVSDRTISRDLKEIHSRNAIEATPELTKELVGELIVSARGYSARVRQLSRSADVSAGDKIKAEYSGWRIKKELLEVLDSLGYLTIQKKLSEVDKKPKKKQTIDEKIEEIAEKLSPMDRDRLIEKLNKGIMELEVSKDQNDETK